MSHAKTIVRIGLAIFMAGAGILHFVSPRPYAQHLPEVVPFRAELVAGTITTGGPAQPSTPA